MLRSLLLFSALTSAATVSATAAEPIIGRWALTPEACRHYGDTAATAAMVVTTTSVYWFDGYCRIGRSYKVDRAVYMQVHCWTKGDVPATLTADGDRMRVIWGGARFEGMKRCR